MHREREEELRSRAHALGESGDPQRVPELIRLQLSSSSQVRRLAVSALGKLADVAKPDDVIPVLLARLRDRHPQVRQYTIKALSAYGATARPALPDLQDIADNLQEKDYNRRDATKAIQTIEEAVRISMEESKPRCQKCDTEVDSGEYARSMKAFQRTYCDKCFNEVYLRRRNWDTQVELNKTIPTKAGEWVQSDGERIIADFLAQQDIDFRYDERVQIIEGYAVRPDFYLPEFDVYLEYWGMNTTKYKIGMLKKREIYQQQGKRLVSLSFRDKPQLALKLREKLSRYVRFPDG